MLEPLEKISLQFASWRNRKPHRAARVPDELKKQALVLIPTHGLSKVAEATGCSRADLKRWQNKPAVATRGRSAGSFIDLTEVAGSVACSHELTLVTSAGVQLKISHLDPHDFGSLLARLVMGGEL